MKKFKQIFDNYIVITLILIFFVVIGFSIVSVYVNRVATNACYETLYDAAEQVAQNIRTQMESDRNQLYVIADLLKQHEEMDTVAIKRHLASFRQRETLFTVALLMPDNRLVIGLDGQEDLYDVFDYQSELEQVPYVSGVKENPLISGQMLIYQAVPMEMDGRTVGIIYGFVNLDDLAKSISVTAFNGNAQVFVADGATGDFLVDTLHDTLGNVFDDTFMSRKAKSGYDFYEMKLDFIEGKAGHIAFWSDSKQEYFYSYYQSVGVEKWMVQLTVQESVAFASAIQIRKGFFFLSIAESIFLIVFFLIVLYRKRRDILQKEQQLTLEHYMYDVQKTLFDTQKNAKLITAALGKVSQVLTAEFSFLLSLDGSVVAETFSSRVPDAEEHILVPGSKITQFYPQIYRALEKGENLLLYSKEMHTLQGTPDRTELARHQIDNLMLVPVLNASGKLLGMLGSVNMTRRWTDTTLLECVSSNFMMALQNLHSYRQIEKMGIMDMLTGLHNRNCYESALDRYEQENQPMLCCLYIDVNGLHELNNSQGHDAGDAMLICTGNAIIDQFGLENSYRIGGDEFVVFRTDCPEEVQSRMDRLCAQLDAEGYELSIGSAWLKDSAGVKDMIASAERDMYEQKRLYYAKTGKIRKTGKKSSETAAV